MGISCAFCGFTSDDHDDFIPGYWNGDTFVDSAVCHDCVPKVGISLDDEGEYSLEVV